VTHRENEVLIHSSEVTYYLRQIIFFKSKPGQEFILKDMGRDRQSEKRIRMQETSNIRGGRGAELPTDRAQSTRRQKWEIKAAKRGGQKTKAQDKIPSGSPLGKMLKYWDYGPCTIGKKKIRLVKYCCFIWTQEPILKHLFFWPKFGSNKDWVCQLLIEHVNDKSSVTQEKMEYALFWRQSPVVLFPLKEKKKEKKPKIPSNWDLLSSLRPL
jgi:hypothetical protein